MATLENERHTIIATVTQITLLCGCCGKSFERIAAPWVVCPHCRTGLPAQQNMEQTLADLLHLSEHG